MLSPINNSNMASEINESQTVLNVVMGCVTSVRMKDRLPEIRVSE